MPTKMQEFKAAGAVSFTPPANVSVLMVTMSGGGGSGGGKNSVANTGETGGGGGEFMRRVPLHVTPGVAITGVVGGGGARGNYNASIAPSGGTTSFGPYQCLGGIGGGRNDLGGNVGSIGGGYAAASSVGGNAGPHAVFEYDSWNAGAGGGGPNPNGNPSGYSGGACEGHIPTVGGARFFNGTVFLGAGSGGASGGWGLGGAGGDGNTPGNDAPAGSYGAGGGGGGPFQITGGGASGYILLEWQGP